MKHTAPLSRDMEKTWRFFGFDPAETGDVFAELDRGTKR